MACLEESTDKYWCKSRNGVLYFDDFSTPLAGRYTVLADDGVEGWEIIDAADTFNGNVSSDWYEQIYGSKILRVRHMVEDCANLWRIRNDEFPDPYKLDSLGRDYPWWSVRLGADAVTPVPVTGFPGGFPYDFAWGGIEHKIQASDNSKRFAAHHMHRCGLFGTWVKIYYWVDGAYYPVQAQLVNLCYQFWYAKHHVQSGAFYDPTTEVYFSQGKPAGWSVQTDARWIAPEDQVYKEDNGSFGFVSQHCCSWNQSSYTMFHGLVVCETNYITIYNIPPNPNGDNAIPGLPEGVWRFKMEHPEIGVVNNSDTYTPNDEDTIYISFDDHNYGWEKIQVLIEGPSGTTLVSEFAPSNQVNGGDIYCFDPINQNAAVTCAQEPTPPTPGGPCECEGGIHVDTGECQAGIVVDC
jgi:hypothetical protein